MKKYPEGSPDFYHLHSICEAWKAQGFQIQWELLGTIKKTQDSFSYTCHVEGEDLRFYVYHAWRTGKDLKRTEP